MADSSKTEMSTVERIMQVGSYICNPRTRMITVYAANIGACVCNKQIAQLTNLSASRICWGACIIDLCINCENSIPYILCNTVLHLMGIEIDSQSVDAQKELPLVAPESQSFDISIENTTEYQNRKMNNSLETPEAQNREQKEISIAIPEAQSMDAYNKRD